MRAADLRNAIRASGLRATSARIAVCEVLAATSQALSQADLVERLPDEHDRTTIYRVLAALVRSRLLRRIETGDRVWRYRFVRAESHGVITSFVCTECDRVTDLTGVELRAAGAVPRAFTQRTIEVLVRGVCDACTRAR